MRDFKVKAIVAQVQRIQVDLPRKDLGACLLQAVAENISFEPDAGDLMTDSDGNSYAGDSTYLIATEAQWAAMIDAANWLIYGEFKRVDDFNKGYCEAHPVPDENCKDCRKESGR